MVRTLKARGIETRLVIGPYLPAYAARSVNLRDATALLAARVHEVDPDAVVWDYSTAIADPAAFADRIHLNVHGSRLLLQKMRNDGFFRISRAGGDDRNFSSPPRL